MRILYFLPLLFLISCSHQPVQKKDVPVPPHPCFGAAASGDLDYLQKNLETCKATKTAAGTNVLMLASAKGQKDSINFLIQNGMDIDGVDVAFSSALDYAVVTNRVDSAEFLILSGASLESKKPEGITPLMTAVQIGSPAMIRALTTTRQAVNAKAQDGWTAIYFSIRRKDPGILSWLLRQGACKNVVDSYKQTPMDFAKEVEWKDGIAILEKAPACGPEKPAKKKAKTKV